MRSLSLLLIVVVAATACTDRKLQTFTANVPQYMSFEELRESLTVGEAREIENPGKFYFYQSYMLINQFREGIHIVDLSDPEQPETVAYIEIPGNVDMAVRNNLLYADSYVDLVVIDISDPENPVLRERVKDLLEYVIPPYDTDYPLDEIDREKGVVTGFEVRKVTREVYHHPYPGPVFFDYAAERALGGPGSPANTNRYGVGGSMARFLTYDDYLYVLESTYKLKTLDVSLQGQPRLMHEQYLWGNIETLFILEGYMYVGSSNGMHILSLREPSVPTVLSSYRHVTACDPVVVSGNRAYVTLRAGNLCGGTQNLLEVIDVSDKSHPLRIVSYAMTEPYGLGVDGSTLFVCEGPHGLKVFDAGDDYQITEREIARFENIHAYDVIPLESFLFLIGDDGFQIYDYSDLTDIRFLAGLPVAGSNTF